jgi:DNA-binding response OmpR family regulator
MSGDIKTDLPDIVVIDTLLGDYDGYELIRKIRSLSDVPVMMLSYIKEESQMVKALELGVDDYIVKPVRSLEIIASINMLTKQKNRNSRGDVNLDFISSGPAGGNQGVRVFFFHPKA